MYVVAVFGIGSTNFRYAAATPDGRFLTDVTVEPTRPRDLIAQILDALESLDAAIPDSLDAVAVSTTGLVDDEVGVVRKLDTPEGETVDPIPLGERVDAEWSLPFAIENDCNAAALGEWFYGARVDERSLVHLTVGTGIGGGIVEDGRLVRGADGQAGEFGLLPVAPDTGLDSCGATGAWEAVCAGRGIPEFARHHAGTAERDSTVLAADELTASDVFEAAADGDAVAESCLGEIARYNAVGVGAICNAVNPSLVTVGGGVALNNEAWFLDGIERHLDAFCFVDPPEIRTTELGDDIGLYGALATYRSRAGVSTSESAETGPSRATDATD